MNKTKIEKSFMHLGAKQEKTNQIQSNFFINSIINNNKIVIVKRNQHQTSNNKKTCE